MRVELRRAREQAELTQQQAADVINASVSKINRIENGSVPISTSDLKVLLDFYGVVDPERRGALIEAARASRERPWWHKYRGLVRSQLPQMLAYESEATAVRSYHPYLITGLLQSPAYARELRRQTMKDEAQIKQLVDFTVLRQEILGGPEAPTFEFIVDVAALRRKVGGPVRGPELMIEQLDRLKRVAASPNVALRILHEDAGAHPAMNGPFTLFDCFGEENPILFIEGVLEDVLSHIDVELIKRFEEKFDVLRELSLSEEDGISLIEELVDDHKKTLAQIDREG